MTPIAAVGSTIQKRRPRITVARTASGIRKSPKWRRIAQAGAKSASVRKSPRSPAPALMPATSSTIKGAAARTLIAAAAPRRIRPCVGRRAATTTPTPSVVVRMKRSQGLVATTAAARDPAERSRNHPFSIIGFDAEPAPGNGSDQHRKGDEMSVEIGKEAGPKGVLVDR